MAKKVTEQKPASELVAMSKDGETIQVCPAQVEHHQKLGWTLENIVEQNQA